MAISVPGGHYVCLCCGLFYPIQRPVSPNVEHRMHQSNTVPKRCSRCAPHRGDDAETRIRIAEDHARWYWEFAEQKDAETKAALAQVDEIKVQMGDTRDRMIAAFRSRDAYIRVLADVAKQHQPTRNGCSCRRRDCETFPITDQPWVRRKISELERCEDYDEDTA
ncbi:hypothetical protein [Pseudonocardia cypriaca]|uniref:Uncharacterized protein n=1 Tax=Pseudonocardia cypriaca TaxID=882449 RepID=A0A543GDF7_9PSEU|nr:hypothetical protein [Pseudonocardia cypriaca]TQM44103.1 hypothetical protein FB388_1465 [Pseudonocardia cypriaca]